MSNLTEYGFGHLSIYMLQLEEGTPFHKTYFGNPKKLPDEDL
jgi:coproporphyrinogen III oxidase-like Fe-S oxidoreductase